MTIGAMAIYRDSMSM